MDKGDFGAGEGIRTLDPNLGKDQVTIFSQFARLTQIYFVLEAAR
jgi:hypothetical protein